jgi:hypothetical protein
MAFAKAEIEGGIEGPDLLVIAGRSAELDAANTLLRERL